MIPDLLGPTTLAIVPQSLIVRHNLVEMICAPRAGEVPITSQAKGMSLARFFQREASIINDPSRNDLHKRYENTPQNAILHRGVNGTRSARVHEAWRGVDKSDPVLVVVFCPAIKSQARADGALVDHTANTPVFLEPEVALVDSLFFGAVEDR